MFQGKFGRIRGCRALERLKKSLYFKQNKSPIFMKKLNNALRWFEIPVVDLERARTFYEKILQTELTPIEVGAVLKMALFPVEAGTVGGALCQHKDFYHPGQQGPLLYLNGDPDLQPILDRVEEAGGKIMIKKQQISEKYGFMAIFEDTEGNRIGIQSGR